VRRIAALAAVLLAACSEPPEPPQLAGAVPHVEYLRGADWPSYNRDLAGTRYSPLRQVSATNVDELRQAWSYPLGSAASAVPEGSELTPVVVDGVLYATAADRVVALRADTGAEIWRFALPQGAPSQRGVAYWPGDDAAGARIFFTAGRTLVALDALTGQKVVAFGSAGEVAMPSAYTGAPTRFEDLIVVGSNGPPGGVRAYDVRGGAERWRFVGAPTLVHPASSLTVDVDRALLYAVFAGPEPDLFYGGERGAGADPYLNSVVALDARTGNARWHFQTVHHDLWNYDLGAPPALFDVAVDGTRRALLALAGRAGYLYLLDRVTGEPVFEVVETPVPASDVPGEHASPTQPVPRKPSPIARVGYAAEDIVAAVDTTAQHAAYCRSLRTAAAACRTAGRSRLIATVRRVRTLARASFFRARSAPRVGAASPSIPSEASSSSTRAAKAASAGWSRTPAMRRRPRPASARVSSACRTGARAPSAVRSRASGRTIPRPTRRATSGAGDRPPGPARNRRGAS